MSEALAALRAGVVALLRAHGEAPLAEMLEVAGVELVGAGEQWSVGSRTVVAQRVVVLVDAEAFVRLSRDADLLDRLRSAFAAAMQSPYTALAHLDLVLRLPALGGGWHHVYRSAPSAPPERADPEAVLAGAGRLVAARGDGRAEQILGRASLEADEDPGAGFVRYVLRLDPADLVEAERDRDLAERLRWAVERAGTRPSFEVAGVVFASLLDDESSPRRTEST